MHTSAFARSCGNRCHTKASSTSGRWGQDEIQFQGAIRPSRGVNRSRDEPVRVFRPLPSSPGVHLFCGTSEGVLYVGNLNTNNVQITWSRDGGQTNIAQAACNLTATFSLISPGIVVTNAGGAPPTVWKQTAAPTSPPTPIVLVRCRKTEAVLPVGKELGDETPGEDSSGLQRKVKLCAMRSIVSPKAWEPSRGHVLLFAAFGFFQRSILASFSCGLPGVLRPSVTYFSSSLVRRATRSGCSAWRFFFSARSAVMS